MADLALVRTLEERTFNAWPSLQTVHLDGWLLRMALGHTKRANAASAWLPQNTVPPEDFVNLVKDLYSRHSIEPMVRITPLTPKPYEEAFRKAGWVDFDFTFVLTCPLNHGTSVHSSVKIDHQPSHHWVDGASLAYELADWQREALGLMVKNIRVPAAFATVMHNDNPAGFGLGVAERGFLGLFDLAIKPQFRSQGLGRLMIESLFTFGAQHQAHTAYLQVRQANERARELYENLGFSEVYSYYCLKPASARSNFAVSVVTPAPAAKGA